MQTKATAMCHIEPPDEWPIGLSLADTVQEHLEGFDKHLRSLFSIESLEWVKRPADPETNPDDCIGFFRLTV